MTGGRGLAEVETGSIVADLNLHRADPHLLGRTGLCKGRRLCRTRVVLQVDVHAVGSGMFGDIVERFLANPVERHLEFCGENVFSGDGHADRNVRPAREGVGQLAQQIAQAAVGQDRRPQFGQQFAHLGQGAARQPAQVFQRQPRLDRVALPQTRQDFGDQTCGEERLVDGIVKVLCQALAFLQRGERPGTFVQLGIDHGDRDLVGHRQGQGGVVGSEAVPPGMRDAQAADEPALDGQGHPHPRAHSLQEHGCILVQQQAE